MIVHFPFVCPSGISKLDSYIDPPNRFCQCKVDISREKKSEVFPLSSGTIQNGDDWAIDGPVLAVTLRGQMAFVNPGIKTGLPAWVV